MQYFVSFTDDWYRKVLVYFLKTKDEAFDKFVERKRMVETQSERKVKKLIQIMDLSSVISGLINFAKMLEL